MSRKNHPECPQALLQPHHVTFVLTLTPNFSFSKSDYLFFVPKLKVMLALCGEM